MNAPSILVFYANQVLLEFFNTKEFESWRRACCVGDREIYNGAYIWYRRVANKFPPDAWFRMDQTPVLLQDVPTALRAWVLIL